MKNSSLTHSLVIFEDQTSKEVIDAKLGYNLSGVLILWNLCPYQTQSAPESLLSSTACTSKTDQLDSDMVSSCQSECSPETNHISPLILNSSLQNSAEIDFWPLALSLSDHLVMAA